MERIASQNERSSAIIEDGKIKMTKRLGKWDAFESSGQYLEPHVALFYMELVCKCECIEVIKLNESKQNVSFNLEQIRGLHGQYDCVIRKGLPYVSCT